MNDMRLDALLAAHRADLDAEIAASGSMQRVRDGVLARHAIGAAVALPWLRVAAAVLVAATLGGALDLAWTPPSDSVELALNDPLYALELADLR